MPSAESSRRNLLKARARHVMPRPFRSTKESRHISSVVWQWVQRGRSAPGSTAALDSYGGLDSEGYALPSKKITAFGAKESARSLAKKLGCSHTHINNLKREFKRDPSRQERAERTWGPASIEQVRAEVEARKDDWGQRYRLRRKRPAQRAHQVVRDGDGRVLYDPAEIERQVKAILKAQKDRMKDYGHL